MSAQIVDAIQGPGFASVILEGPWGCRARVRVSCSPRGRWRFERWIDGDRWSLEGDGSRDDAARMAARYVLGALGA